MYRCNDAQKVFRSNISQILQYAYSIYPTGSLSCDRLAQEATLFDDHQSIAKLCGCMNIRVEWESVLSLAIYRRASKSVAFLMDAFKSRKLIFDIECDEKFYANMRGADQKIYLDMIQLLSTGYPSLIARDLIRVAINNDDYDAVVALVRAYPSNYRTTIITSFGLNKKRLNKALLTLECM